MYSFIECAPGASSHRPTARAFSLYYQTEEFNAVWIREGSLTLQSDAIESREVSGDGQTISKAELATWSTPSQITVPYRRCHARGG